jgi:hypothetical protein
VKARSSSPHGGGVNHQEIAMKPGSSYRLTRAQPAVPCAPGPSAPPPSGAGAGSTRGRRGHRDEMARQEAAVKRGGLEAGSGTAAV